MLGLIQTSVPVRWLDHNDCGSRKKHNCMQTGGQCFWQQRFQRPCEMEVKLWHSRIAKLHVWSNAKTVIWFRCAEMEISPKNQSQNLTNCSMIAITALAHQKERIHLLWILNTWFYSKLRPKRMLYEIHPKTPNPHIGLTPHQCPPYPQTAPPSHFIPAKQWTTWHGW